GACPATPPTRSTRPPPTPCSTTSAPDRSGPRRPSRAATRRASTSCATPPRPSATPGRGSRSAGSTPPPWARSSRPGPGGSWWSARSPGPPIRRPPPATCGRPCSGEPLGQSPPEHLAGLLTGVVAAPTGAPPPRPRRQAGNEREQAPQPGDRPLDGRVLDLDRRVPALQDEGHHPVVEPDPVGDIPPRLRIPHPHRRGQSSRQCRDDRAQRHAVDHPDRLLQRV